jgi:hypothetical protein
LQDAVPGSFESVAEKTYLSKYYCKSDDLGGLSLFRMMSGLPADNESQFYPLSKGRFDGYVFEQYTDANLPEPFNYHINTEREGFMHRYLDSLKISITPYGKTFDFTIDPAVIAIPEGFRWKSVDITSLTGGITQGFFESDDRECVVTFGVILDYPNKLQTKKDNRSKTGDSYDPYAGNIYQWARFDLQKILAMEGKKIGYRLFQTATTQQHKEKNDVNFGIVADKIIDMKSADYAQSTLNADKALEYTYKSNYYVLPGCKYIRTICAEKNERRIILKCAYTEKGYANRDKYQKSIESIFKFK